MSFLEAVRRGFTVWAWRGRASRSEFWYWAAAVGGMYAIYFLLTLLLAPETIDNGVPWLVGAVSMLGILKVAPRRLRDANESPYQVVVILLSLLGAFILTGVLLFMLIAFALGGGDDSTVTVIMCATVLPLVFWASAWARQLSKPGSRETSNHDTPRTFLSLRNPVFRIVLFGLLAIAYLLFQEYRPF